MWECIRQIESWPAIVPAYVGLRSMPLPATTKLRSGVTVDLEEFYDIETLWQIFCRHVYDVHPSDRIVIDAGANIGLFACYAASVAPHARIHAVEPFPRTFDRLVDTVRRNALGDRVTCHRVALSASAGAQVMSTTAEASQMFHLAGPAETAASPGGVVVHTTTLPALMDAVAAGDHVDLLKMDIEGMEYEVLLSMPVGHLRRIRRVNVEFHQADAGRAAVRALVQHLERGGLSVQDDLDTLGAYGMLHFTTSL